MTEDSSSKEPFRRAVAHEAKTEKPTRSSEYDDKTYHPKPPQPILVPRGKMADGRMSIDRRVREQEMIKKSKEKFAQKERERVESKDNFNKKSRER